MSFILLALLCLSVPLCAEDIEGFTEPYRSIDLAAPDMGVVASIHVKEGARVQRGHVIASLDSSVLQRSLAIAEFGAQASGRLESAKAELRMQASLLKKLEQLRTRNHASHNEVERTRSQQEMAAARVKVAEEELAIKALEHKRIEAQLSQRAIASPIDGIVTLLAREEGEFVSPSDPVVAKIVQLDPLLVIFSVPSSTARKLKAAQSVPIELPELKEVASGIVEFVSPTPDAQSGTTRVRVRIPNPNEVLPSGMGCRLVIPERTDQVAKVSS